MSPSLRATLTFLVVFIPMLVEARRSRQHERALRDAGAREPAGDVYALMQIAYPLFFLVMIAEGWWRGAPTGVWTWVGVLVFAAGKGVKYWAIAALGPRWTFRVLVPPGSSRVARGPYRWIRHPNYVGVAGELTGIALVAPAPVAGTIGVVLFIALMLARIRVEERALGDV